MFCHFSALGQRGQLHQSFLKNILFLYFWLHVVFIAAYGLCLAASSGDCCLAAMHGLLTAMASLAEEHGLRSPWAH